MVGAIESKPNRKDQAPRSRLIERLVGLAVAVIACAAIAPVCAQPLQPDIDQHYQKTCLTAGCHESESTVGLMVHPPYLEGKCLACHLGHDSEELGLLKPVFEEGCVECHGAVQTTGDEASHAAHPPLNASCSECHAPHTSPQRALLREAPALNDCAKCHSGTLRDDEAKPHRHAHFEAMNQCGECHSVHSGSGDAFIRGDITETCTSCHRLSIRSNGRDLENVAERLKDAPVVHGAIGQGGCAACHTPHGSISPKLLRTGYPEGPYIAYQRESYNVCWACHDPQLVEAEGSEAPTAFRDGEVNLHRTHVVEPEKGRACHLCHRTHGTEAMHLVRDEVSFNRWTGPLVWKPEVDGAVCTTACHRELAYER